MSESISNVIQPELNSRIIKLYLAVFVIDCNPELAIIVFYSFGPKSHYSVG